MLEKPLLISLPLIVSPLPRLCSGEFYELSLKRLAIGSPLGHGDFVEQKNLSLFGPDVAALLQILDDTADHFARCPDHPRDFLLRRRTLYDPYTVDFLGLVEQQTRDASIHVDQCEAFYLAIRIAKTLHEIADNDHRQIEVVFEAG